MVAVLAEVGGSQIDEDGLWREVESTVLDRRAHALAALTDGRVGQTDDLDLRQTVVDVDFDLDRAGFDAPGSGGGGFG